MHLILVVLYILAGIKWGDWRNWRLYYPTILFFAVGDLLYNLICCEYPMWEHNESVLINFLPNHTIISLLIMITIYPATIVIFLGKFPKERIRKILWILLWVGIYGIEEFISLHFLKIIHYHNGWTFLWSIIFDLMMFPMLWLHYKNPLIALLCSVPIIVFLVIYFKVPVWIVSN